MYRRINTLICLIVLAALLTQVSAPAAAASGGEQSPASPSAQSDGEYQVFLPAIYQGFSGANAAGGWSMAAASPERTSLSSGEVRGTLAPAWYKPFEPYISPKVQIIAAYNLLFVATARGLYALDAASGAEVWVFPTELPLGHSPTVVDGVVYVGGMDKKLYALNATNGALLWAFPAGAGFDTNPLVVGGRVYAGSRDGNFYAIYATGANAGREAWRFPTGGPIHFSAAYKDGLVFFASDDSHAYALNASNGAQVWKSAKLPGAGFHSWWPVVYQDVVIFAGSSGYRANTPPFAVNGISELDYKAIVPGGLSQPDGTPIGTVRQDGTMDLSKVMQYYETYPWRRTVFVLNRANGQEVTYDFDRDGKPEYAPFLWYGTYSGNRYPPVVGVDGLLYTIAPYENQHHGFRGAAIGWKIGTPNVTIPSAISMANDEPMAIAAGGRVIYYNLCCDRASGAFDATTPNPGRRDATREWVYFEYNLESRLPNYGERYRSSDIDATFGGQNGVYGLHGDQNPPIPYNGRVYMHRSNAVIAFGPGGSSPVKLPTARTLSANAGPQAVDKNALRQRLADEVRKMLAAGHLRPGYGKAGNFDRVGIRACGDNLLDYFSYPWETIDTLLAALPHLPQDLVQPTRAFIQAEFAKYPPYDYQHTGWKDGAPRDAFPLPAEVDQARSSMGPREWTEFRYWDFPPQMFYTLWKYAETFGGAGALYDRAKARLDTSPPSNSDLLKDPYVLNAYIAGYTGYLELEKLAGRPVTTSVRDALRRLTDLRVQNFSKDSPYGANICAPETMSEDCYCKTMNVSRNFLFLTPELADALGGQKLSSVQAALNEYNDVAPYWFANKYEATYAEGASQPIHDAHALFQARALILKQPAAELIKYLDAPAFPTGDLYYLQNLIAVLNR